MPYCWVTMVSTQPHTPTLRRIAWIVTCGWLVALVFPLTAQPLPAVPLGATPGQLSRGFGNPKGTLTPADCAALQLNDCAEAVEYTARLRWVQLDDDTEMEALLEVHRKVGGAGFGFILDRRKSWRVVGALNCVPPRWDGTNRNWLRVKTFASGFPPLLTRTQDLGGSGQILYATEAYHLRNGRLSLAFDVRHLEEIPETRPRERQRVYASADRVIIHTIRDHFQRGGRRQSCQAWRWDAEKFTIVPVPEDQSIYCDASGQPIPGTSTTVGLPIE